MENSKGRVRNFVVSNKEVFCDVLARTLCEKQISYVQIDNEFHFMDKVCRFYSFEESLGVNKILEFVSAGKDKIILLNPENLMLARDEDEFGRLFSTPQEKIVCTDRCNLDKVETNKGFTYTKQRRRVDNKINNQKIKQSAMMGKKIINRKKGF